MRGRRQRDVGGSIDGRRGAAQRGLRDVADGRAARHALAATGAGRMGAPMYQYRVTKYDPAKRDRWGAYPEDEWISQCQIGQAFGGVVLTAAEYQRVENAYVTAALAFIR